MTYKRKLLYSALASLAAIIPLVASAETVEKTIPRGKPAVLLPILIYEGLNCGTYPPQALKIDTPPSHGRAQFITHAVPLGDYAGVCKGKVVNAQFLVYQPAANYAGPDSVSISYAMPNNTGETHSSYMSKTVAITVK